MELRPSARNTWMSWLYSVGVAKCSRCVLPKSSVVHPLLRRRSRTCPGERPGKTTLTGSQLELPSAGHRTHPSSEGIVNGWKLTGPDGPAVVVSLTADAGAA